MWNWIKKIATAVVVVAVVTAVVATGGLAGVALIPTVIACTAIGAATGAVAGAVIEGVDAKCKGESFWKGAGKGAIQGAGMGAAIGLGCGVAAAAAVAGGVGGAVTSIGYALGAGSNAAVAGVATVTALGGLAGLGVGAAGVAAYEHMSNQTSNQNQQNANQKQAAAIALEKGNNLKAQADSSVTKTEKLSKLQDAVKEYVKYTAFHGTNNETGRIKTALEVQIRTLTSEQAAAAIALERANSLKVQADSSVIKAEKLSKLQDAVKEYVKYTAFHGTNNEAGRIKTALEVQIRTLTSEQAAAAIALERANSLKVQADSSVIKAEKLSKLQDAVKEYVKYTAFHGTNNEAGRIKTALEVQIHTLTREQEAAKAAHDLNEQARILVAEANIASGSEKIKKYEAAAAKFHSAYLTNRGSATNDAVYLANEAIALNGAGNHTEALKIADKALGLDANNTSAKAQKTAAENGIAAKAAHDLNEQARILVAEANIASGSEKIKKYEAAAAKFHSAYLTNRGSATNDAVYLANEAIALNGAGNHIEALKIADKALGLDANNTRAKEQKLLACIAKAKSENQNEDYSEAIKSADAALSIDHNNFAAKNQKIHSCIAQAVIVSNSKDYIKACSLLKTAILTDENHNQVQEIRQLLEVFRKLSGLQQEKLSLQEQNIKEQEKHAQLRDDIDAIKVKQSDIGIDKQFDIDNDFITRDTYMTVYGQDIESQFTPSITGNIIEDADITNS